MQLKNLLSAAALFVALGYTIGCADTRTATGMTDDEVDAGIKNRLRADAQLSGYNLDVDADVDENKVTLSGEVPTQAARTRAVELAREFNPRFTITDKIEVKPGEVTRAEYTPEMNQQERERARGTGEKIGDNLDDAWIHTKIRTKLVGEGEVPFAGVNVDVVDNVVTLRGEVDNQQTKADVERIARETEGVTQVRNLLRIKG